MLVGRRIERIERRGKWLRFVLDRGRVFSHLGMTGKWVAAAGEPVRFEKVRLDVAQRKTKRSVRYVDPRLFGRFVIADDDIAGWSELGPDPLHDGVDAGDLLQRLSKRCIAVKAVLLDQGVLAGVGNIQATDAMFLAGIDPRTPAKRIDLRRARVLARSIERSIERTLAAQSGKSMRYFGDQASKGSKHDPNPFVIYGRGGEPCPRCGTKLSKIVLAGRGTVFCRVCQERL
jgi:formamidopyrimidine-DNA glycosylase